MRSILTAAGALLLLAVGFYWKLTATEEYLWMDDPDLSNQVLPWWNYQAREWHAGRFPLWEPHQWAGQPLIGQTQPGAAYPLNWLLFNTPLKDGKLRKGYLDAYFVSERYIAALNAFLLCWYLRRGWWASLVAACVFGFGGFVGNVFWPQMVNGVVWAPLVVLFALRAGRKGALRDAALSGFFLGLCWLSGHHQAPIFITYAVAGVWLWMLAKARSPRFVALGAVMALFFAMTAALQVLPAYEYGKLAVRWTGAPEPLGWRDAVPYQVHTLYSLRPEGLAGLFLPPFNGLYSGFVGAGALVLGITGVLLRWRHPVLRGFAVMSGLALAVALGWATPLHGWMYAWLPMVEKARTPAAALAVFNLGFAVLVAFGLEALARGYGRLRGLRWTAAGVGAAVVVASLTFGKLPGVAAWADPRMTLAGICVLIAAALLSGRLRGRTLAAGFLALVLVENSASSTFRLQSKYFPRADSSWFDLEKHDDIAAYLRTQPGPVRVMVDDKAIPYNFGDFHGIDAWGGYLASVTVNLREYDVFHPRFQRIFGITHELTGDAAKVGTEVFRGKSGVRVLARPDTFPRAWAVHDVRALPSAAAVNGAVIGAEYDLRNLAFVEGVRVPRTEPACGADAVSLTRDVGGWVEIDVEMACAGVVVLGDVYFPGWRAAIDGREAEIFPVDGPLRGVTVPKGRHRVIMEYRPRTVTVGAWSLGASVAGLGLLALLGRRRR